MKINIYNRRTRQLLGITYGIGAAVCYGTNPFGALNLYQLGMNTGSVLFYRFALAWVIVACIMALRKESFKVNCHEFGTLTALGILFSASSLSLYISFRYMAAGIASTILFIYPVMTAVIMMTFFHEKASFSTLSAIALSMAGVALLYWTDDGGTLPLNGVFLVLLSALTYAIYIVVMGRNRLRMSSYKINFYVLIFCSIGALAYTFASGTPLQLPHGIAWCYVGWLALVPAIMALVLMVYATKLVGSTPTAITGALEPLTAVLIGVIIFGEPMGIHTLTGIVLILAAVILLALKK